MYGNHPAQTSAVIYSSMNSQLQLRHACVWWFRCGLQLKAFKTNLKESIKYGNINVLSVTWIKYHHTVPNPYQRLDQSPNCWLGLTFPSLGFFRFTPDQQNKWFQTVFLCSSNRNPLSVAQTLNKGMLLKHSPLRRGLHFPSDVKKNQLEMLKSWHGLRELIVKVWRRQSVEMRGEMRPGADQQHNTNAHEGIYDTSGSH